MRKVLHTFRESHVKKVRLIDNATKLLGLSAQHEVCNVRTEPHVVYPSPRLLHKETHFQLAYNHVAVYFYVSPMGSGH